MFEYIEIFFLEFSRVKVNKNMIQCLTSQKGKSYQPNETYSNQTFVKHSKEICLQVLLIAPVK